MVGVAVNETAGTVMNVTASTVLTAYSFVFSLTILTCVLPLFYYFLSLLFPMKIASCNELGVN